MDTSKVTRLDVVDHTTENKKLIEIHQASARLLARIGVKVELSLQDDGRTLKVFLNDL